MKKNAGNWEARRTERAVAEPSKRLENASHLTITVLSSHMRTFPVYGATGPCLTLLCGGLRTSSSLTLPGQCFLLMHKQGLRMYSHQRSWDEHLFALHSVTLFDSFKVSCMSFWFHLKKKKQINEFGAGIWTDFWNILNNFLLFCKTLLCEVAFSAVTIIKSK